jgi:opacity protein-like surface antigen
MARRVPWSHSFSATALTVGIVMVITLAPARAGAEWLVDLYLGAAMTNKEDVEVETSGSTVSHRVGFNRSAVFGGRVGYWFDSLEILGVALDASHFRPDTIPSSLNRLDLYVTPVAAEALLRWPLFPTGDYPHGRLQPYLFAGPAFVFAEAKDTTNFPRPNQYETTWAPGFQAGTGIAWHLFKNVAVFGEYRFTHFHPEFSFQEGKLRTDLDTHYGVAGVSLRF